MKMLKMKKIFRKEKFDLIQYSTPNASLYASLAGKWSRRINSEHRLIYAVHDDRIEVYIFSMRYHYSKK